MQPSSLLKIGYHSLTTWCPKVDLARCADCWRRGPPRRDGVLLDYKPETEQPQLQIGQLVTLLRIFPNQGVKLEPFDCAVVQLLEALERSPTNFLPQGHLTITVVLPISSIIRAVQLVGAPSTDPLPSRSSFDLQYQTGVLQVNDLVDEDSDIFSDSDYSFPRPKRTSSSRQLFRPCTKNGRLDRIHQRFCRAHFLRM